jgi:hypothetical protein
MDFNKMVSNKYFKVGAAIVLPTILVAAFYGYRYLKNKNMEKANKDLALEFESEKKKRELMRANFKGIKNANDFIQAVKYLEFNAPFGYNLAALESKKDILEKYNVSKLNEVYNLLDKGIQNNSDEENDMLLNFVSSLFVNNIGK